MFLISYGFLAKLKQILSMNLINFISIPKYKKCWSKHYFNFSFRIIFPFSKSKNGFHGRTSTVTKAHSLSSTNHFHSQIAKRWTSPPSSNQHTSFHQAYHHLYNFLSRSNGELILHLTIDMAIDNMNELMQVDRDVRWACD